MAEKMGFGSSYSFSNPSSKSKKKPQSDAILGHTTSYKSGSNTDTTSKVRTDAADYLYSNNQASTYNQPRPSSYGRNPIFGSSN